MTYQELPLSTKIKIKMICNRNNITKPSDIETAYNNYVEGRDIFEGLSEDYQRVSAFDNYLANGGHIYSGEDEDTQQMQKAEPNIFQRPDGSYFYQVPGGEEIDVTPINTLSEDNSRWTYTDASGRIYNPAQPLQSNYSLTEAENANAVERAINNYTRELAWREANDPASIALQGKYVLPAIGMSSLAASPATLPYLNTALASGFGAHGIQDLANGNADWQTALEVAPLASLAKPMVKAAAPTLEWAANGLERNVGLGRNAAGDWNGWIRIGNTEYRPPRTSLSANPIMPEKRTAQPVLSEGMRNNGWVINDEGFAINTNNPNGPRFVWDGKRWISEASATEAKNAAASKTRVQAGIEAKEKPIKDALLKFEKEGIQGFSVDEWKAFRRGFPTTEEHIKKYESNIPEYYKKFKELKRKGMLTNENGVWMGKIDGEMVPVNPRQYIKAHSKNFIDNGWKYDGYDRGIAIYPGKEGKGIRHDVETVQKTGGIGLTDWTTTNNSQLAEFSRQRHNGPILHGIVTSRSKPDRVLPHKYAHEAANNSYKGITEFDTPIDYKGEKGLWRILGKDMQFKAIDGNTGEYNRLHKNPLESILPPILGLGILSSEY
jgi:hypothetical protein